MYICVYIYVYTCIYIWLPQWLKTVKKLPAMRETQVRSLDGEDSLKKGMATHSNILAGKIPWIEEPGGLQSHGVTESDMTE